MKKTQPGSKELTYSHTLKILILFITSWLVCVAVKAQLPASGTTITSSASYTIQPGVYSIQVECWGGGGGGGGVKGNSCGGAAAGGGGGGAYSTTTVSVTPGQVINFNVAAAVAGGSTAGTNGTAGQSSSAVINSITVASAAGGTGGTGLTGGGVVNTGAAGGSTGTGTIKSGGTGGTSNTNYASGGGGGGASTTGNGGNGGTTGGGSGGTGSPTGGPGGAGVSQTSSGSGSGGGGTAPGGGGGGGASYDGGSCTSYSGASGGIGAAGQIKFSYSLTGASAGTINPNNACINTTTAVSIPYTVSGTFNGGNVFTGQLSDASGSFASPTNIGNLTSTGAGTISASVPASAITTAGSGYLIRVSSSNPATTGLNTVGFTVVNGVATPSSITGLTTVCPNTAYTYSVTNVAGYTYNWTLPSGWSGTSSTNSINVTTGATVGGPFTISVTGTNSCGTSGPSSVSVTVTTAPLTPGPITHQ